MMNSRFKSSDSLDLNLGAGYSRKQIKKMSKYEQLEICRQNMSKSTYND